MVQTFTLRLFGLVTLLFYLTTIAVADTTTTTAAAASNTTDSSTTLSQQLGLNIANVPSCAVTCAQSLPTNCNGNPQCICSNSTWMNDIACCVATACTASDLLVTQQFAGQLCQIVGESLPTNPNCPTLIKTTTTVNNWVYQGCYSEATNYNRALNATYYIDANAMTPAACVKFCNGRGYKLAGVEYAQECWCGNEVQFVNGAQQLADDSKCNMLCKGDSKQYCGGSATLNIYKSPKA